MSQPGEFHPLSPQFSALLDPRVFGQVPGIWWKIPLDRSTGQNEMRCFLDASPCFPILDPYVRPASQPPRRGSRWPIHLLGFTAASCVALGGGAVSRAAFEPAPAVARTAIVPPALPRVLEVPKRTEPRLEAKPITRELRQRGYHECYPPDPMGLGPYAPMRNLSTGHVYVPQRGGHTEDMGFDVLVHFHGLDPIRKDLSCQ